MRIKGHFPGRRLLPCLAAAGLMVLAGCQDSNYDFDEIDMTMGFGGDGLALPVSGTDTIKLVDVLELDGTESVVIKPNGDYVFELTGDDVQPARPEIGIITVSRNSVLSEGIPVVIAPVTGEVGSFNLSLGGNLVSFSYEGAKPDDVVDLDYVGVRAGLSMNVDFPDVMKVQGITIDRMVLNLPPFMELDNVTPTTGSCTVEGSSIVFTNVSPSDGVHFTAQVVGLDFRDAGELGSIDIEGGQIKLNGKVNATIDVTVGGNIGIDGAGEGEITAGLQLDDISITSATGRFDPTIDLDNLGNIDVTGVPDFLTDGNVVVDLYNPQIHLTLDNDMDVKGFVSGVISSYKGGAELCKVTVPEFAVNGNGTTKVCICRKSEGVDMSEYDQVIPIANLSELIDTIPDRVMFDADVRADAASTASFILGHQYTVTPSYAIEAPIAFAENAKIVYTDTLDGINDDINDLELADNSYLTATATIENRVPAYLTLHADAIDVNGNLMSEDEVSVDVDVTVLASSDGVTSVETPLTVNVRQNRQGALKKLDGLVFRIEGSAADKGQDTIVGQTLNSEKHFIIARDIVVKIVGKVIGDFN